MIHILLSILLCVSLNLYSAVYYEYDSSDDYDVMVKSEDKEEKYRRNTRQALRELFAEYNAQQEKKKSASENSTSEDSSNIELQSPDSPDKNVETFFEAPEQDNINEPNSLTDLDSIINRFLNRSSHESAADRRQALREMFAEYASMQEKSTLASEIPANEQKL